MVLCADIGLITLIARAANLAKAELTDSSTKHSSMTATHVIAVSLKLRSYYS